MNREDLARLISELDIDTKIKSEMANFIRQGQTESAVRALKKYRSTILNELHSGQDRLYQIDFVLQKATEEKR